MKAFIHKLAIAFMLLLVSSCSEVFNGEDAREIIAYADNDFLTKTGIEDNGSGGKNVVWKSGDAISLFFNTGKDGGSKFTTTNSGAVATFSGSIPAISGDLSGVGGTAYFWAVYPYNSNATSNGKSIYTDLPNAQKAYAGDISDNLLITVGRSPNLAIHFRNACSVIEFTVKQENIAKISFSGGNNEIIAGRFQVSFDDNASVVVSPSNTSIKEISVTPAEAQTFSTGTKYYLVLLPRRFSNGYSLTFTRSDGFKSTYSNTTDITLKAGTFYTMYNKDNGLVFTDSSSNTVPVPTAIDLGLSVKWANFNLGASKSSEYGDYYPWGALYRTTGAYNWIGYRFYGGSSSDNIEQFTKYNTDSAYGPVDNNMVLDANDDVAHVKLGGKWRMPTREEVEELISQCSWKVSEVDGVAGYTVKSLMNGKQIFLPGAGHLEGGQIHVEGQLYYWTSSLCEKPSKPTGAHALHCNHIANYKEIMGELRYYGLSIRPVQEQ